MSIVSLDLDIVDFDKGNGVVTVVAQDADTGEVLMVAQADREALAETVRTGEMHYRSRTRGLWHKGATSGNIQAVVSLTLDCDRDAVLALVRSAGPACHTGDRSCFSAGAPDQPATIVGRLDRTIAERAAQASDASSYTRKLLGDRNLRLKKLGEESVELAVAVVDGDAARITEEAADLLYHMMVTVRAAGIPFERVAVELAKRMR